MLLALLLFSFPCRLHALGTFPEVVLVLIFLSGCQGNGTFYYKQSEIKDASLYLDVFWHGLLRV